MALKKVKSQSAAKPTVKKRTLNWSGSKKAKGAPASEQDPKRRLGDFTTAGEHARTGSRNH